MDDRKIEVRSVDDRNLPGKEIAMFLSNMFLPAMFAGTGECCEDES